MARVANVEFENPVVERREKALGEDNCTTDEVVRYRTERFVAQFDAVGSVNELG